MSTSINDISFGKLETPVKKTKAGRGRTPKKVTTEVKKTPKSKSPSRNSRGRSKSPGRTTKNQKSPGRKKNASPTKKTPAKSKPKKSKDDSIISLKSVDSKSEEDTKKHKVNSVSRKRSNSQLESEHQDKRKKTVSDDKKDSSLQVITTENQPRSWWSCSLM